MIRAGRRIFRSSTSFRNSSGFLPRPGSTRSTPSDAFGLGSLDDLTALSSLDDLPRTPSELAVEAAEAIRKPSSKERVKKPPRSWTHALFSCLEEPILVLKSIFCFPCLTWQVCSNAPEMIPSSAADLFAICSILMCPLCAACVTRNAVRHRYKIGLVRGGPHATLTDDICVPLWCSCCATVQEHREDLAALERSGKQLDTALATYAASRSIVTPGEPFSLPSVASTQSLASGASSAVGEPASPDAGVPAPAELPPAALAALRALPSEPDPTAAATAAAVGATASAPVSGAVELPERTAALADDGAGVGGSTVHAHRAAAPAASADRGVAGPAEDAPVRASDAAAAGAAAAASEAVAAAAPPSVVSLPRDGSGGSLGAPPSIPGGGDGGGGGSGARKLSRARKGVTFGGAGPSL